MRHIREGLPLALAVALLSAGPAFTPTAQAQTGSTNVANIYIQSHKGIYVFSANAQGKLTLVKGSLFADAGQIGGVRGSYLISVGTNELHSYQLGSNGAVGRQVAQITTTNYGGSQCGTNHGATLLDHTGQYFSVALLGGSSSSSESCAALQTYKVAPNGEFTFLGDTEDTEGDHYGAYGVGVSTYSSNDLFAYGVQGQEYATVMLAWRRATAGDLVMNGSFAQTGPTPSPSDNTSYEPVLVAADPSSHLAAVVNQPFGPNVYSFQLASYTINKQTGAITSTNTYANMPVLQIYPNDITISWGGNLVAVGGAPGLQVFHFNGASPATAFGGVLLPNVQIDQVAFDKNNHLYALSYESGQLYVYTVTSTSITEAPGSPYSVPDVYGWNGLIVVPQ